MGKTTEIKRYAEQKSSKLFELVLFSDISPQTINDRLRNLQDSVTKYQEECCGSKLPIMTLCIKIDTQNENKLREAYRDQILFQILILQNIRLGEGYMNFQMFTYFDLEIGNCHKDFLLKELSCLQVLHSKINFKDEHHVHIEQVEAEKIDLGLLGESKDQLSRLCQVLELLKSQGTRSIKTCSQYTENQLNMSQILLDTFINSLDTTQPSQDIADASYQQLQNFVISLTKKIVVELSEVCQEDGEHITISTLDKKFLILLVEQEREKIWSTVTNIRKMQKDMKQLEDEQTSVTRRINVLTSIEIKTDEQKQELKKLENIKFNSQIEGLKDQI